MVVTLSVVEDSGDSSESETTLRAPVVVQRLPEDEKKTEFFISGLNKAPVPGFERDAGSKTTIRLVYPEGAPHSAGEYTNTAMVALVVFKSLDLDWLASVITKQTLSFWSKLWFWREVVEDIPLKPENFRILHPEIVHRTGQALQSYAHNQGKMVPTLGASAVVMALQLCDQMSLAGFGYDMQHPEATIRAFAWKP